jgi:hypothetical protein
MCLGPWLRDWRRRIDVAGINVAWVSVSPGYLWCVKAEMEMEMLGYPSSSGLHIRWWLVIWGDERCSWRSTCVAQHGTRGLVLQARRDHDDSTCRWNTCAKSHVPKKQQMEVGRPLLDSDGPFWPMGSLIDLLGAWHT